jgi:hypothetical protein
MTTECLPSVVETLSVAANLTDFLVLPPLPHLAQSCLTQSPPERTDDDSECFRAASPPMGWKWGNPAAS